MTRTVRTSLLPKTMCPHCWHAFEPHEVLWVSVHPSLTGDPRLGPEQATRYLPSRFTPRGLAIDAKGQESRELACPSCHLTVPRAFLEMKPWFASILGTPACGKSFFLAAMIWELRNMLPQQFALAFSDIDAGLNATITEYEQQLFQNPSPDKLVSLSALIRKTEEHGELYSTVLRGDRPVNYPRPMVFSLRPQQEHWQADGGKMKSRVLCLYDNAGESFLTGKDSTANPVTRHLAQSSVLLYLFDPTQHQKFRERLTCKELIGGAATARYSRQDMVLIEAAGRVRRFTNLPDTAKHDKPLFVIVTKRDLWNDLLPDAKGGPIIAPTKSGPTALNLDRIEDESKAIRAMLRQSCPEVVNAAEEFCENVYFFGVSALGAQPEKMPETNLWGVRPMDLKPLNVAAPILFGMHLSMPGIVPVAKRQSRPGLGKPA